MRRMSVPLPAPDGPEMTMSLAMTAPTTESERSTAQHVEQFFALTGRQAVDGLG
jgi:hypothetical protein